MEDESAGAAVGGFDPDEIVMSLVQLDLLHCNHHSSFPTKAYNQARPWFQFGHFEGDMAKVKSTFKFRDFEEIMPSL